MEALFLPIAFVVLAILAVIFAWSTPYHPIGNASHARTREGKGEGKLLKEVDIFRRLSDEQLDSVVSLGQTLQVPAGQVLGNAGEMGSHLYVIKQGNAQLSVQSSIGQITVRIAGPGETFPLAVLIGSGRLITSVKAMTDMKLLAVPRSELMTLCSNDSRIGMLIHAAIGEVLGNRYRRTLDNLTSGAERSLKDVGFFANV